MRERQPVPGGEWVMGAIFVTALLTRLIPTRHGVVVDYDEGVYVTAAALFGKGLWPYRDFVFVHPPGVLLSVLPWTIGGPLFALNAARVVSAIAGAFNATLVARLVGGRAAIPTAVFAIVWPELVWAERGVYLEPLMSCAGLGALVLLTRGVTLRRATLAGVLCGLAVLVKSWGLAWCLAAFLCCAPALRRRLVLSAIATVVVVLLPFLFVAGGELFSQLVLVHLGRPPDGDATILGRLRELFVERNVWPAVLTALTLPLVLWRGGHGRIALVGFALLVAAFLASPAYWNQYNAALVPFELWLLGAGLGHAFELLGRAWWGALLLALVACLPSRRIAIAYPASTQTQLETVAPLREVKTELCAFEVAELVLINRLPALTSPVLVDSYGQQLLDARRGNVKAASTSEAFSTEAAQVTLRQQLTACPAVRTGWRGDAQMNGATKAWLEANFTRVGDGLYERK